VLAPYRAIALDYDGTLTTQRRPDPAVLEALARARAAGCRVVLATGRIVEELLADFGDVLEHVDALVAENGCVVVMPTGMHICADPVERSLDAALRHHGVPFRRGRAILASEAVHAAKVLAAVNAAGLECQLVFNKGALMILPAGVSKGTGVAAALFELHISPHNAIGFGDAENDHSLLEACELGVAVGNAIDSLRVHADVSLTVPNGAGIVEFLDGTLLNDRAEVIPSRRRLRIGHSADGAPMHVPATDRNILITGAPGSGKSYVTGLIAERLIDRHYVVAVIDPHGDHTGLARFPDVEVFGGVHRLPSARELLDTFSYRFDSVVLDLSRLDAHSRWRYVCEAASGLKQARADVARPHRIIVDEAHDAFAAQPSPLTVSRATSGYCLSTYRPELLPADTLDAIDLVLVTSADVAEGAAPWIDVAAGIAGFEPAILKRELVGPPRWRLVVVSRRPPALATAIELDDRRSGHVRHWHKYVDQQLAPNRRFYFRSGSGPTGESAANIPEFSDEIARCDLAVLFHHAAGHDFSRWIGEVLLDPTLAARVQAVEEGPSDSLRHDLVAAVGARYGELDGVALGSNGPGR
jgi:hydroxymethylpyrimidine pyrophosphatase-like HAD family hydrolase